MEKLNEYMIKCANEIKSRGLCEEGDEARPAFLMVAVTDSPASENVGISISMGGDGVRLVAAIVSLFDENPTLARIFKTAMERYLIEKMRTKMKCNTEC